MELKWRSGPDACSSRSNVSSSNPRAHPRRIQSVFAALILVAAMAAAIPAAAQYMYMDTNGDSLNTWADSLSSTSPTATDIWLDTGANRDDTPGSCGAPGLTSFSFILKAVTGSMSFGTFTSARTASGQQPPASSSTEYHIAVGLNPSETTTELGRYKLGTLNVQAGVGNPCLEFAPGTTLSPRYSTSYGAGCVGPRFDHTSRLGTGWSDWDALSVLPSAPPQVTAPGIVVPPYLDPVVITVQVTPTTCGSVSSLGANLSALPPGHNAVFSPQPGNLGGTLTWQPTASDHGDFPVTFTAASRNPNARTSRTTIIRLVTDPVAVGADEARQEFALWQNRPNPFNPLTTIRYSVPGATRVQLILYDVTGRPVAHLVDHLESPGPHEVAWSGNDDRGRPMASGVYWYRLTSAFGATTRRLVLAR